MRTPTVDRPHHTNDLELLIREVRQESRRRRLRDSARAVLLTLVVAALVATVVELVSVGSPTHHRSRPITLIAGATKISLKARPTLEVYHYSGEVEQFASTVYFRRIGSHARPQALNAGMWANETPPIGSATDLAVYGTGAFGTHTFRGATIYRVGTETVVPRLRTRLSWNGDQPLLLAAGDDVFLQPTGLAAPIDEVDIRTGRIVHSFPVPGLPFLSEHGLFVGNTNEGVVPSLAVEDGRLYAFQFNGQSASIDDLSSGTHRLLRGYGALGGGVVAANGDLYVMAWRADAPASNVSLRSTPHRSFFDVLRIDPVTLSVVSTVHTGVRAWSFDNVQMQALPDGSELAFVAQQRVNQPDSPIENYLWKLTGSRLEFRSLPANTALDMRAFGGGIYLFGGPGRNVVARVDLSSLSFERSVPRLRTPSGSWIFALT